MDLATTVLSGTSIVLGAGLAMVGQLMADVRTRARDRESRREEFRVKNFEIQRDALLEMQEVVLKFSSEVREISMKAMFADALPNPGVVMFYQIRPLAQALAAADTLRRKMLAEVESDDVSNERKRELLVQCAKTVEELRSDAAKLNSATEGLEDLVRFEDRLKVLPARTGDQNVFKCSSELLQVAKGWTNAGNWVEARERSQAVEQVAEQVLNAIGESLRNGPFS